MFDKNTQTVLDAREQHYEMQQKIQQLYHVGFITIGLNIPGPNKTEELYHEFFQKIIKPQFLRFLIEKTIDYQKITEYHDETGDYLIVILAKNSDYQTIKAELIALEQSTDYYRLADFDVYNETGKALVRRHFKTPMRRCYLCPQNAKCCAKAQTHELKDLLTHIKQIMQTALENKSLLT